MEHTSELDLAWDFVEKTDRNIFLTGKAGTGKTTFLHKIKNESLKRKVVVAPTGVAAINAGGVTIHSFFQMPFGPILPESAQTNNPNSSQFQRKFNRKKIDIIRSLDLLIIDEISMVRADLLDGIDQVLRKYKNRNKVFGGVQVLMIGDLQQLAPIVKNNEWQLLRPFYETAFFFSSKAFQQSNAISIELRHIFRQQNQEFIEILNQIRNNNITKESLQTLNKQYNPDFRPKKDDGFITLTTHNDRANSMNQTELVSLDTKSRYFRAEIDGDFPEYSFPTHEKLELKVGAQVMFIKNDSSPEKRYYNGKIGKITKIEEDEIFVQCPDDYDEIVTTPEKWDNVNYTINSQTKEIEENLKGSFTQIPLRLAWSITIHKSQGLTFEKAIIDAKSSFAHGQTYVALSRCKTLEGIVLKSPIESNSIISDNTVKSFTEKVEENQPDDNDLLISRKQYQLNLVNELFSYYSISYQVNRCKKIIFQNLNILKGNFDAPLKIMKEQGVDPLIKVADNFNVQLAKMCEDIAEPEKDKAVQERITKALQYFIQQTEENLVKPLSELTYITDNKLVEKDIADAMKKIDQHLKTKSFCYSGLISGFQTEKYLKLRADAVFIKAKPTKLNTKKLEDIEHSELYESLRQWRHVAAIAEDISHYQIFTQKSLFDMCDMLPLTSQQLTKVNGMGKVRVKKYGAEILEIIKEYCQKKDLDVDIPEELAFEEPKKVNTKQVSFGLFNESKTIPEIAEIRGLTISTIESHLSYYITLGDICLEELLSNDKASELKELIENAKLENVNELFYKLGKKYTYGEIRMALCDINYNKS